jgi:hypothetical protein
MRRFLRRRRPVDPAAVGCCEHCGVARGAPCRADMMLQRAGAVALLAGRP